MGNRKQGFQTLKAIAGDFLLSDFDSYANSRTLLTFLCRKCKEEYETTSFLYQKSEDGKRCQKCKQRQKVNSSQTREVFIGRCRKVHGQYYQYSLVPQQFNKKDKIKIICPKHGPFEQTPDVHLRGSGCQICKIERVTNITRTTIGDFMLKANQVHGFKYNYSDVNYVNAKTHVKIICPKHGPFEQTPDVHLRGSGCQICSTTSVPVQNILERLKHLNIVYSLEKTFPGCRGGTGRPLRFDIFIPEYNLCVEYDGPHHFKPTKYNEITEEKAEEIFKTQLKNDEIKTRFCEQTHIDLIRIPYTHQHPDAAVIKYISSKESERHIYTWADFSEDIIKITNYIKSFSYSQFAIYGVSRGGIPFAVNISNHFDSYCEFGVVKFQRYDGNDSKVTYHIKHASKNIPIFVVDDLISSGETMKRVIQSLRHRYKKSPVHPIVIFGNENEDGIFYIREHPKMWIVFPYEL